MSVNLKKCKAGDKVQLRNGIIATLYVNLYADRVKYPFYHNKGNEHGFHAVSIDGKSCISMSDCDIVKIIKTLKPSKPLKYGRIRKDDASALWNIVIGLNVQSNNEIISHKEFEETVDKFRLKLAKIVKKYSNKINE
jgi:hypothetical protein